MKKSSSTNATVLKHAMVPPIHARSQLEFYNKSLLIANPVSTQQSSSRNVRKSYIH